MRGGPAPSFKHNSRTFHIWSTADVKNAQFDEDIIDTLAQFASPSSQVQNPFPTPPSSRPATPGSLPQFSPQKVSEALCKRARAVSEQTSATTPFMMKAIDEGIDFVGGKKDGELGFPGPDSINALRCRKGCDLRADVDIDISVLVGVIGDRQDPTQRHNGLALHTE